MIFAVFGLNNFLIKRFSLRTCKLNWAMSQVRRLKCGSTTRIFFIYHSLQSASNTSCAGKTTKTCMPCPDPVALLILDKYPVRTPWYTFSGSSSPFWYSVDFSSSIIRKRGRRENEFHAEIAEQAGLHPSPDNRRLLRVQISMKTALIRVMKDTIMYI